MPKNRIQPGARYLRYIWRRNGKRKWCSLYRSWDCMRTRCNNPNAWNYQYYGGAGIRVCPEWDQSYPAFRAWAIANGFRKGLTIDRKDRSKDYTPENCCWATRAEQTLYRRATIWITHKGRTMCATDWAHELGMHPASIHQRLRAGWDPIEAITTPSGGRS